MNPSQDQSENLSDIPFSEYANAVSSDDWDHLALHVERFLADWEEYGFGPLLADHLPNGSHFLRRLTLVELIKVDLEYRHYSDGPILLLEQYLAEHPLLAHPDGVPAELIYEEYRIRKGSGERLDVADCMKRFPAQGESLARLFQLEATSSMALSGPELAETFEPGDRVEDFYLMSRLGAGAFGCVFLARQESMQRLVALKISPNRGSEGQTLAQLDHPHIVRVYDQIPLPKDNIRLLYMQFAAGGTLQSVIRASRTAATKDALVIVQCISTAVETTGVLSSDSIALHSGLADKCWAEVTCQLGVELSLALEYAHQRGILHRDIKPANVLLEANGSARLADFNISFSSALLNTTPAAYFGGSLAYMSPEQLEAFHPALPARPEDLDARADIFSLGVLLWELFYGHRPFNDEELKGESLQVLSSMIALRQESDFSTTSRPDNDIEQQLSLVLGKCLAPNPNDRYQSATDLARDLTLCLEPRVASLLKPLQSGWRKAAILFPTIAFLVAAVGPHVPAAVFNFFYNESAIIQQLSPMAREPFKLAVLFINGLAFAIGIGLCIWYCRPVAVAVRDGSAHRASTIADTRVRALRLSRFVTLLGISEWTIAGLAYPLVLHSTAGNPDINWKAYFFASLLICGLVAAAYPFFLTATLCMKVFLPALIRKGKVAPEELNELRQLSEQSTWSLYLAGGVPAVGILLLVTALEAGDPRSVMALRPLSLLGALGFALALKLSRALQNDVEAVCRSLKRVSELG